MIMPSDKIENLLEKYPGLNRFLMQRGIICAQCGEPFWGTLGELILQKGLDQDKIMAELNLQFSSK